MAAQILKSDRFGRIASPISLVVVLLISALVMYVINIDPAGFREMYAERKIELPPNMQIVLSPWFQLVVLVLAAAGILKEFLISNRRITLAVNLLHVFVVAIMVKTVIMAFHELTLFPWK